MSAPASLRVSRFSLSSLLWRLLLLPLLFFLTGCPGRQSSIPPSESYSTLSAANAAAVLQRLNAPCLGIGSLRGHFGLRLRQSIGSTTLTQVMVFKRPDKLRVELFATGFQKLVALVIASEGILNAFDPRQQIAYTGRADKENIQRLLRLPFAPEDLMLWSCGCLQAPPGEHVDVFTKARDVLLEFEVDNGVRVRGLYSSSLGTKLAVELPEPRLDKLELYSSAGKRIFFSQFHYPEQAGATPSSIEFRLTEEGIQGELTAKEVIVNPVLTQRDAGLFVPRVPPGVEIVPLDSEAYELPLELDPPPSGDAPVSSK